MKPYQLLLLVVTIVVSATTGLGLAMSRGNQSESRSQALNPQSTTSISDTNPLPNSPNVPDTVMATPTSSPSPVVNRPAPTEPTPDRPSESSSRRPVVLSDAADPGTEFYRFRERLRQAVTARDVDFVSQLIPDAGVSIGFGAPSSITDLDFENPNAEIWAIFEKALAAGCDQFEAEEYYPAADSGTSVWLCPNVGNAFLDQYPNPDPTPGIDYEISHAVIVGNRVNARSLPTMDSDVIGTLTNEVVMIDRQAWERTAASVPEEVWAKRTHPLNGWTPVLLSSNQSGYVSNRYVYQPLEPKLLIGQVNGQWQILRIPAGD